jgi:hypothetical protein
VYIRLKAITRLMVEKQKRVSGGAFGNSLAPNF